MQIILKKSCIVVVEKLHFQPTAYVIIVIIVIISTFSVQNPNLEIIIISSILNLYVAIGEFGNDFRNKNPNLERPK